ncbi:hypothetical protein FZ063_11905 [Listeria monocytogenes]|uniref:DUF6531 domain-containing protein n=1 Tax=Listeria monocytogenes TaxID=1639 RepID=UPI0011EB8632|nr:DUF6531 domain-containing protein [Listeria monocytogenes]TYV43794.1 hypothetical protein FZ063_11905 [Listeria monocytogenes]
MAKLQQNKVFQIEALQELLQSTKALMNTAINISEDMNSEVRDLSVNIAEIPAEAKNHSLEALLSSEFEKSDFQECINKLEKILTKLIDEIPRYDKASGSIIKEITSITQRLNNTAQEYKNTIRTGMADISLDAYLTQLDNMRLATGADKTGEELDAILAGLKGLRVFSAEYSMDPVNLATGNFAYEKVDLVVDGATSLKLVRSYNSLNDQVGALGKDWVHNFEMKFKLLEGRIKVTFEDGKVEEFIKDKEVYIAKKIDLGTIIKKDNCYLLTGQDGNIYTFDLSGKWTEKEDKAGNRFVLSYDKEGSLEKVRNREVAFYFSYDESRLILVKDNSGREVKYSYEEGNLVKVENNLGQSYKFEYDKFNKLRGITNPIGTKSVQNIFDSKGRTVKQFFPDGGEMSYEYVDGEQKIILTEQNGNEVEYIHDDAFRNTEIIYEDGKIVRSFNEQGDKVKEVDKNGNVTKYHYDEFGNLTTIIKPIGDDVEIYYNDRNKITKVIENGEERTFLYNGKGKLISSTDGIGRVINIEYDSKGKIAKYIKADGSKLEFTRDRKGNVICLKNEMGAKTEYEYDKLNRVIKSIDGNGNETKYKYDTSNRIVQVENASKNTRNYTYNLADKITKIEDFNGEVISAEYNELNKISQLKNQAGDIIEYSYDLMWNISKITDANGAEVKYLYDKLNRLACIQNPLNQEQKYSYDPNGNVREITQINGRKIQYTYDEMNRRTSIQDADGEVTKYRYNNHGEIAEIEDALGNTTQFKYDKVGQMIEKVDKLGHKTVMSYTKLGKIESITYANGSVVSYSYYLGGKLKAIYLPDGNSETYEYDLNGNLSRKTNSLGHSYAYVYDELDQVIEIINPKGNVRKFCYDVVGNVTKTEDENGNSTHYYYSCVGNLIRVVDALGNESRYDYNKTGQLTRVEQYGLIDAELGIVEQQNEEAQVTLYEYDLLGRVTSVTDSLGNKELLEYDEMGNVVKKQDKEGFTTSYQYSETGNLTRILYADKKEVAFSYNPLKQLIQIEDWLGTTTAKLDALGRPLEVKDYKEDEVRYTWGSMGERTEVCYPDETSVSYTYNKAMKLISLAVNEEEKARYHYDSVGRLTSKVLSNGVQTDYTYNVFHRYESLVHRDRKGVLDCYNYHYDAVQNKIGITKARRDLAEDSGEFRYRYDDLHRLTQVWKDDASIACYEYDAFGNRIISTEKQQSKQYHYNKNNQLVETIKNGEVQTFKYDKRGNLLEKRVQGQVDSTYTFDEKNYLTKITQADVQSQFIYNGLGSRVERQLYDLGEQQLLASERMLNDYTKTDHNLLTSQTEEGDQNYFWDDETILGVMSPGKDNERFYLEDQLGSPIRLIQDGSVQATYSFDAFGSQINKTNNISSKFGFTGHQIEEVGNLYFAEKRYLDAAEGRFISEDSVRGSIYVPKTMNAYAYCFNQPIDFIDADGAFPSVKDFQDGISNARDSVVNAWNSGVDTVKDFWNNNVVGTDTIIFDETVGNVNHTTKQHIGGNLIVYENKGNGTEGSWIINLPEIHIPFSGETFSQGTSINLSDMSISSSINSSGKNGETTSLGYTVDSNGIKSNVGSGINTETGLSDMYTYSEDFLRWEEVPLKEVAMALTTTLVGGVILAFLVADDATVIGTLDDVAIPVVIKKIIEVWMKLGVACAV